MPQQPDRFLSFAEVAELIGVHEDTVKKGECGLNAIPRIRIGRRVLFSFIAVQEWMAAKAREAEQAKIRQANVIADLMSDRASRQRAVKRTLETFIAGGRYK